MPQNQTTKNYYNFVGGLHTEVTPLTYPEDSVTDISNIELKIDGSLRRRKGLEPESGAAFVAVDSGYTNGTDAVTEHLWRGADGSDTHFHIVQVGYLLHIFTDDPDLMADQGDQIDLRVKIPSNSGHTDAQVAGDPVDISWGRGEALVTGKYISPFYLSYDGVDITAYTISIKIRDFVGVTDGTSCETNPSSLSDAHSYNLQNSGWLPANITQYNTDESAYPARNQVHHLAYLRALTASTDYDFDGVRSYNSAKMAAEIAGIAEAPRGKFIINPFDTAVSSSGGGLPITTWSFPGGETPGTQQTLTITLGSGHGIATSDVIVVSGQFSWAVFNMGLGFGTWPWDYNGTYVVQADTATTIDILVTLPLLWDSWSDQYFQLGEVASGVNKPDGVTVLVRPTTNAYFAGRAWYAGTPAITIGQSILFSQIIQSSDQYGMCYQQADPTSEIVPDLIESDGGQIFIPEAGTVIKLQPFGQSMLVLCDNGVWEIDGGGNRYFDAIDYSVRRVSEVGCISKESVIEADQNIIFASQQGAYRIFVDPQARVLVTESITEEKVNAKWVGIDPIHKKSIKSMYDPVLKRLMWLYDTSSSPTVPTWNYREVLVYDMRLDAFYLYNFPIATSFATETYVKGLVKPDLYTRSGEVIIKYLTYTVGSGIRWTEMTEETFSDLSEVDAAGFMITGYDHMGNASQDKQVKYLTTFMERIPDSSLKMRGRWDFAESSITGKFTPEIEVYRPSRAYLGTSDTQDDDGYPVVFYKATLPGQGVVLQLRFDTVEGADCSLYGWSIDFQGIR